jgi:dinuclear metal center YbgI/SA1388 family protein
MPARRDDIVAFLDETLDIETGADYGPNGLQVEGRPEVTRIALGVTASLALFARAEAMMAELIVVHHGLLFGPMPRVTGLFRERLAFLLSRGLSLVAYHLPLDRHPEHGNNAVLSRCMGISRLRAFGEVKGSLVASVGELDSAVPVEELAGRLGRLCDRAPQQLLFGPAMIRRVAVATGAGADLIEEAARLGAELFITGEAPERVFEQCRELNLNAFFAGHYASERFGLQALCEILSPRFNVEARFIDVPNAF